MLRHRDCEMEPMRRLSPAMRRVLWSLVVLYAIYLVAGNAFLNTTLASDEVNRKPQTFQAQWSWAWTAWPGHIHAYDLTLHGHARRLLWSAHGESAGGRIMLWPLLRRELRFASVRAVAVTVDVQPATADHLPPPWRSDAWRISAGRISTASLRQVRWGELVIDGHGAGQIGFTHQLRGGPTEVFPSRITMPDARVQYRQWPLLHDTAIALDIALDPFTHDDPPGWRKAERAVGRLKVTGTTMAISLGASRPAAQATMASPLEGHLSADVSFDRGTLVSGGRLQWNAPVAITDADGKPGRRRGQFDLAVQPDGVAIHARIPPPPGADGADAMNRLEAHLQFASRRLLPLRSASDELRLLSGTVDGRWHFASLSWLTPLTASKPWLHLDGAGDVDAALRLDAGRLAAGSRVDVPRVNLQADVLGNVFAGHAHAQARVVDGAAGTQAKMALAVERFTLAPGASPQRPYLQGRALQVDMRASSDLARLRETLLAQLTFADAQVPDLRSYNRYLPGKSLYFLSGSGRISSDLTIDGKGDVSAGRLQMSSTGARIALGVSRLAGNLRMDTRLKRAQRSGHAFELDGFTLGMDGVRVEGSRDPPWWARFTLEHGRLDWDRPMQLQGSATMTMKDVSLLLSLFADRGAFPAWIGKVVDAGQATARAQVQAQRGDFVLDRLVASNRRVDLFAHLRVHDGVPRGDLYARWGVLGLGVALADGKRTFHVLHARRWYEAQPDLIPPDATPSR
jgi:hypothetical protein